MKVLLVGNYKGDKQWSMNRFCNMLFRGLQAEGVEVEVIRPAVVLGGRNKWMGYADKFVLFWFTLRRAVKTRPGWVVHIIDQGNGIYAGGIGPMGPMRCAVTCHDLLAIRAASGEFPEHRTPWTGRLFQSLILSGLQKARCMACVSGATQRDAERLIGDAEIIPNGLEDFWRPLDPEEAWKQIDQAGVGACAAGYLLHVGGSQWYKGRPGAVRVFINVRKQTRLAVKLLMVGPALDGTLRAELKAAGLDGDVVVLTAVSDELLRALYAMARLLIFPSLEEGFGWPILEAQACGCPVVATAKEPMRETGGKAAIFADEGEWANAIADALKMDDAQRAAVVAAGRENARCYTVKRMAREYIDFYRRHFQ